MWALELGKESEYTFLSLLLGSRSDQPIVWQPSSEKGDQVLRPVIPFYFATIEPYGFAAST